MIIQARIPLEKNGGTIYYEVHKRGASPIPSVMLWSMATPWSCLRI